MKLLVHGDISNKMETYKSLGILVVQEIRDEDGLSYILQLPDKFKLKIGAGPKAKQLPHDETYPYMQEYVKSNDNSLNDFIMSGMNIVASGSFLEPEKEDENYDYEVASVLRIYNDRTINAINYTLSSEVDIAEYYGFIEHMLKISSDELIEQKTT